MGIERVYRMSKLLNLSRKAGLSVPIDYRYEYFFDFLRLSQSYWLAHRYRQGGTLEGQISPPQDFAEVLKTYDAFGAVTDKGFDQWWTERAQFQFGVTSSPSGSLLMKVQAAETASDKDLVDVNVQLKHYLDTVRPSQNNRAVVVLALPIHANRVVITHEFHRLLNASGIPLTDPKEIYPYRLIPNKIREGMMDDALRVTVYRAANPKKKLLEIGMEMAISPDTFNENTPEWDYEKRRDLENLTSRTLRRSFRLAENAARGLFPCLDPVQGKRQQFDLKLLEQQLREYM